MDEILRRRDRAVRARNLVMECMKIEEIQDNSVMTCFKNFFLQISFSELHPLILFCFARQMCDSEKEEMSCLNELNLKSVYGTHTVNDQASCYVYRAAYWLDENLDKQRLFEILDRLSEEAFRGFRTITGK